MFIIEAASGLLISPWCSPILCMLNSFKPQASSTLPKRCSGPRGQPMQRSTRQVTSTEELILSMQSSTNDWGVFYTISQSPPGTEPQLSTTMVLIAFLFGLPVL